MSRFLDPEFTVFAPSSTTVTPNAHSAPILAECARWRWLHIKSLATSFSKPTKFERILKIRTDSSEVRIYVKNSGFCLALYSRRYGSNGVKMTTVVQNFYCTIRRAKLWRSAWWSRKFLKLARYLGNDEVCRNFRFFCAFLGEPNVFPLKQYMESCIKNLQLVNMSHCSSISIYIIFGIRAKYNPKILHFF